MNKDTIILVMYVGIDHMEPRDVGPYMERIVELTKPDPENEVKNEIFYLPEYGTKNTRIECINPKLLSEEEFADARAILEKLRKSVEENKY